jgi:hypothetical protein
VMDQQGALRPPKSIKLLRVLGLTPEPESEAEAEGEGWRWTSGRFFWRRWPRVYTPSLQHHVARTAAVVLMTSPATSDASSVP